MEKIQSAIAKARAARAAIQTTQGPVVPTGATSGGVQTSAATQAQAQSVAQAAQQWAALPAFSPAPGQLARNHVVTAEGGRDALPFDLMRTRILQQMRANNWRRLAITSPGPGCGKTTIALNLAFSLGRQADLHTILAELDLRRPALARTLGLRTQQNFAGVLEGTSPFDANAVRIGSNLAIATNQTPYRNSAELLHSPSIGPALEAIEAQYDPALTIFDMPPMLVTDDVMAVMGQMDCVLLIAAAEATKIKEIDACERELASQTNILGVVLNKCRYMEDGYGHDYYG